MKKIIVLSLLAIAFTGFSAIAQETKTKSMNVTVYNDNLGVIREIRETEIKSGISELRFTDVAEQIDPTTVHIKFNGNVIEQNYQYDLVSLDKILSRYIDKEIMLVSDKNVIEGTLLSVGSDEIVLSQKSGGLLMLPKYEDYRVSVGALPEGLITKPTLVWKIDSKQSGKQDLELTYQTAGMSWHAEYVGILSDDEKTMDLSAWVSIDNRSGAAYKDAQLKLVAGDFNRTPQIRNVAIKEVLGTTYDANADPFVERTFFDYHIYELQGKTDISQNEIKQISLFNVQNVSVNKKYYFKTDKYFNGDGEKVKVIIEFENSQKNKLGIPLPKGRARMNKRDNNAIEFVGEDFIDHTPKDEKVELYVGDSFDIIAEETVLTSKYITNNMSETENEIVVKNKKNENIIVEVVRNFGRDWEILKSSLPYEKKDASTVHFKIPVMKNSETKLVYQLRQRW